MSIRFVHLRAHQLAPYQAQLARLESHIRYPIGDGEDHFRIDHGPEYGRFFERMGEAHFLLAFAGDELVGTLAGVVKSAIAGARRVPTVYAADYKVAPAWRGGRLSRRYLLSAFGQLARPTNPRWCIAYGAAMRGARGDVTRSARSFSPLKLVVPMARLAIYFIAPTALAALEPAAAPPPPLHGLDLSPDALHDPDGTVSTAGCKDLRLESSGQPWPLVHLPLGPSAWRPNLAGYLRACGESLRASDATTCFALDERLTDQIGWLAARGIRAGATCTIHGLRLPFSPRPTPSVHLATSEI